MDKLEPVEDIDEKYFLSSECVKRRFTKNQINEEKGYGFRFSSVERESEDRNHNNNCSDKRHFQSYNGALLEGGTIV